MGNNIFLLTLDRNRSQRMCCIKYQWAVNSPLPSRKEKIKLFRSLVVKSLSSSVLWHHVRSCLYQRVKVSRLKSAHSAAKSKGPKCLQKRPKQKKRLLNLKQSQLPEGCPTDDLNFRLSGSSPNIYIIILLRRGRAHPKAEPSVGCGAETLP